MLKSTVSRPFGTESLIIFHFLEYALKLLTTAGFNARDFTLSVLGLSSPSRLWVFDRSRPYNSEKFDIHKEPERFVKVLAGYAMMSDAELGLNTFIKHDGNGKYIVTRDVRITRNSHELLAKFRRADNVNYYKRSCPDSIHIFRVTIPRFVSLPAFVSFSKCCLQPHPEIDGCFGVGLG